MKGDEIVCTSRKPSFKSIRLPGWDYASPAWYFVTICTKQHRLFFGEITDGKMILSPSGRVVVEEWKRTEEMRPNVHLDIWTIMPNHFHGIIVLLEGMEEAPHRGAATRSPSWQAGSLGSIINHFKGACTRKICKLGVSDFGWQPRFYDHIIRTPASLQRIRTYIEQNPAQWSQDKYHPSKS